MEKEKNTPKNFEAFLRKWFGLNDEYLSDNYKRFAEWHKVHGKDITATPPEDTPAAWDDYFEEWIYQELPHSKAAHEAWSKAQEIVEDLAALGCITEAQSMDIQHAYCDIALDF